MTGGSAHRARDVGGQHALGRSEMLDSVSAAGARHGLALPGRVRSLGADRNAGLGRR